MKRILSSLFAMVAVAAMCAAQTGAGAQPSNPGAPAQGTPAQTPPVQTAPGAAAPTGTRPQPQAKSQDEYKAFLDASGKTGGAAAEAAATDFAAKFPQSDLSALLYMKAMRDYQNADNAEKTIEMGHKALGLDPNNPEALVTVASVLSERTRDTDLDRDERLGEATRDANKALETVNTDLVVPPNIPADKVEQVKNVLRSMAYSALGTVDLSKKNYTGAETNLKKATELNQVNPDPITWLRLSIALDQQKKYPEALNAANKAIQYSADMPQANNLAKMERDRLVKLSSAPAGAPATQTPPTSPSTAPVTAPSTSPSTSTSPTTKPSTPPPAPKQ